MTTVLVIIFFIIAANIFIYMLFSGGDARKFSDRVKILEDDDQLRAINQK